MTNNETMTVSIIASVNLLDRKNRDRDARIKAADEITVFVRDNRIRARKALKFYPRFDDDDSDELNLDVRSRRRIVPLTHLACPFKDIAEADEKVRKKD